MKWIRATICGVGLATVLVLSTSVTVHASPLDPTVELSTSYQQADSVGMVLANLQTAYRKLDIDGFLACLGDDFEFVYLEVDSITGENIETRWGMEIEAEFHEEMFSEVEWIELTLSGEDSESWTEDETGASLALMRRFTLKIATEGDLYETSGDLIFVCTPDADGIWHIIQWWDVTGG